MKEIHDFILLRHVDYGTRFFSLTLQHQGHMQPIAPGQFVEVLVEGEPNVMLRRPISVHDVDEEQNTLTLLIQTVGRGTRRLSQLAVGDHLNLVYPLGHGFTTELPPASRALLVGGGAGIAPLLHLSKVLKAHEIDCTILLGGRTADLIPAREQFPAYGKLALSTDDGSLGEHGLVTENSVFHSAYDIVYACGPTPMMKAVARECANRGIRCEVSLENMMACGVGACLCCVTQTDHGHRCVCKDGPVFDIQMMNEWYK